MSRYLRAAARVFIVLVAAAAVGLSLFAVMQLVVHPLMGPPRRQQSSEGSRRLPGSEQEGPRRAEGSEGGPARGIRLRTLLGLAARILLFGAASVIVILVQWVIFGKPPRFFVRRS